MMHHAAKRKRARLETEVIRRAKVWASAQGVKAVDNAENALLEAVKTLRAHERQHGHEVE
jgi:hypothetical protein